MHGSAAWSRAPHGAAMSRGIRTLRGAMGATIITLLAAVSHGIAGGVITPLSVAATALLALPICTLLAGRVGSLWRVTVSVFLAQFVYHWAFAGIGVLSAGSGTGVPQPAHAEHLAALQSFSPAVLSAGAADGLMWLSHVLFACLTVLLLHRGEQAAVSLARTCARAMSRATPRLTVLAVASPSTADLPTILPLHSRLLRSVRSLRGPPLAA